MSVVYEVETWRDSQPFETRRTYRDGDQVLTEITPAGGTPTIRPATDSEIGALEGMEAMAAMPADPLHQLAQAIVDATTLDDVKPVAQSILSDGDFIV